MHLASWIDCSEGTRSKQDDEPNFSDDSEATSVNETWTHPKYSQVHEGVDERSIRLRVQAQAYKDNSDALSTDAVRPDIQEFARSRRDTSEQIGSRVVWLDESRHGRID